MSPRGARGSVAGPPHLSPCPRRRPLLTSRTLRRPPPLASPCDRHSVFGGITLSPPGAGWPITFSTELWALNLVTSTWVQVARTTPWPDRAGGFFSTGLVLGRTFYVYETSRQGNTLMAWSPDPFGPAQAPAAVTFTAGTTAAVSAGFAIEILLGIATLAVLIFMCRGGAGGGRKQVSSAAIGDVYSGLPSVSDGF